MLSSVLMAHGNSFNGGHTILLSNCSIKNGIYKQEPVRRVQVSKEGYIVTYTFEKANIINDPLFVGRVMWQIPGFGVDDTPNKPALLYRLDSFVVPNGYNMDVKLIDSSYVDLQYSLSPARPPLIDSGNEFYTKNNVPEITAYNGFLPINVVGENNKGIYRGKKIANVFVSPIQYDYRRNVIRAYKTISYKVF